MNKEMSMGNEIGFDELLYLGQDFVNVVIPTIGDARLISEGASVPIICPSMSDFPPICDSSYSIHEDRQQEEHDLSDEILRYINQILMEDFEDKDCVLQEESLELQAAEKPFYEAIGESYPPSHYQNFGYSSDLCGFVDGAHHLSGYSCYTTSEAVESVPVYWNSQAASSCVSSISSVKDGLLESPTSSTAQVPDLYNGSQSVSLFNKGVEEARKLIPSTDELTVSSSGSGFSKEQRSEAAAKVEMNKELKGKKHNNRNFREFGEEEEEERSGKQASVYKDTYVHSDIFDTVLLNHAEDQNKAVVNLRETLKNESIKKVQQRSKGLGGRRRQNRKKVVDLTALLMNCAQAVTADDHRRANEMLRVIRQNSSPLGDGNQRLAHCLANGLEARLVGTGSQVYRALVSNGSSSTSILKAYLVYLAACPFRKVSNLFSNRTISKLTCSAARIHIIDFGILYGFQWPAFIQHQSERSGGPPMIRVTGIDFPQPGFKPARRVEETGRRLAHYAKEFGVPFEFNPIAKRWETVRLEDFKLEEDDVVIVNCIYQMKNLPDETMAADRSRNTILDMIRKINPAVFIQGVVNGAYNAPFYPTRFREALFHFSSFFDMLENVMPRESEERLLLEKEILGREALNVVACEGWERVERPETYKQWQARSCRAGLLQLPLDPEIRERARARVKTYHKDFVIDQGGNWLLLGWKGRIVYALSTWKPT